MAETEKLLELLAAVRNLEEELGLLQEEHDFQHGH